MNILGIAVSYHYVGQININILSYTFFLKIIMKYILKQIVYDNIIDRYVGQI